MTSLRGRETFGGCLPPKPPEQGIQFPAPFIGEGLAWECASGRHPRGGMRAFSSSSAVPEACGRNRFRPRLAFREGIPLLSSLPLLCLQRSTPPYDGGATETLFRLNAFGSSLPEAKSPRTILPTKNTAAKLAAVFSLTSNCIFCVSRSGRTRPGRSRRTPPPPGTARCRPSPGRAPAAAPRLPRTPPSAGRK